MRIVLMMIMAWTTLAARAVAQEDVGADRAPVAVAPVSAASPTEAERIFTIGNDLATVEVSSRRGAVAAMRLVHSRAVALPQWRQPVPIDPDEPLAVLDGFHDDLTRTGSFSDLHTYWTDSILLEHPTRIAPAEGHWELVEAEGPDGQIIEVAAVLAALDAGQVPPALSAVVLVLDHIAGPHLHVVGLDPDLDAEGLKALFEQFGAVGRHGLHADRPGSGHVTMGSLDEARAAIAALDGSVQGQEVRFLHELQYRLRWAMVDGAPRAEASLSVSYQGRGELSLRPFMYAINGIHQDDPLNERRYLAAAAHFDHGAGGAGLFDSLSFPAPGVEQRRPITAPGDSNEMAARRLDYLALRSRFFTAIWRPGHCRVVSAADADPQRGELVVMGEEARPGVGQEEGLDYRISAQLQGFIERRHQEEAHQAQLMIRTYPGPEAQQHFTLRPGQRFEWSWSLTAAGMLRRDLALLSEIERKIEFTSGFYRFFRILTQILTFFLDIFYGIVRHYAVAVILLTVLVKALLHRLSFKQQQSMLKMQQLGPEMKRLQEQYKGDRQALGLKQMELFRKHNVNPMAGCLPLLIQMPIFLALFQTFSHSADIRGTGFLWVNDLTLPDQLYYLGFSLPLLGAATINPLPLIYMGASMWMSFSHKVPPNSSDQQRQMAMMMRWMPVFFGLIFYHMPAGLVLYFCCSAILGAIEIRYIRRKLGMT